MKCRICRQEMHERDGEDADHYLHRAPVDGTLCFGCEHFALEMQLFLIRATSMGHSPMGDWTAGYLHEIIENPTKHH